jgi:hypothetical protein
MEISCADQRRGVSGAALGRWSVPALPPLCGRRAVPALPLSPPAVPLAANRSQRVSSTMYYCDLARNYALETGESLRRWRCGGRGGGAGVVAGAARGASGRREGDPQASLSIIPPGVKGKGGMARELLGFYGGRNRPCRAGLGGAGRGGFGTEVPKQRGLLGFYGGRRGRTRRTAAAGGDRPAARGRPTRGGFAAWAG